MPRRATQAEVKALLAPDPDPEPEPAPVAPVPSPDPEAHGPVPPAPQGSFIYDPADPVADAPPVAPPAPRTYSVTFTTGDRLQLNLDVVVPGEGSVQDAIEQVVKHGLWGDRDLPDGDHHWFIPGSQIQRVEWTEARRPSLMTGAAADPNAGPGGK